MTLGRGAPVGHGVDDGFDARELALVDFRIFGKILERTHLGACPRSFSSGPILRICLS